jgi:hypothetical protein
MTRVSLRTISLSSIGRLVIIALILIPIVGVGGYYRRDLQRVFAGTAPAAHGGGGVAKRVIVYRLDTQRPTVFRFSNPAKLVRILTQPVLLNRSPRAGEAWPYAIKAELIAADGSIIAEHEVHSQAIYLDSKGQLSGSQRFFRNSANIVAVADEVSIASDRPAAILRITLAQSDKSIADIDVRVYEQRPITVSAAESAFYRLSPGDQNRTARPNAFPPTMLTRDERVNLAMNQWYPIGPQGVEGRDYQMLVAYERTKEDSE